MWGERLVTVEECVWVVAGIRRHNVGGRKEAQLRGILRAVVDQVGRKEGEGNG